MSKLNVAVKTLAAIEAAIDKDQGARFRSLLRTTMPLAEDAYRGVEDDFRSHLGASMIGRPCAREIWYGWRWTTARKFEARMLRLFNRGHLEEARFVALLLMIDVQVWQYDENGKQFRITGHSGHYGGGLDAVVRGIPDMPSVNMLAEFKTHNDNSFTKVKKEGVRNSKVEHFAQMQQYMGANKLEWAIYFAVNKDTDEIYAELVPYDAENDKRFYDRASAIINSVAPPVRINNSPGWYQCKFCDQSPVCHGAAVPARNCRTCLHVKPVEDGKWVCTNPAGEKFDRDKDDQLKGCDLYQLNPSFKSR